MQGPGSPALDAVLAIGTALAGRAHQALRLGRGADPAATDRRAHGRDHRLDRARPLRVQGRVLPHERLPKSERSAAPGRAGRRSALLDGVIGAQVPRFCGGMSRRSFGQTSSGRSARISNARANPFPFSRRTISSPRRTSLHFNRTSSAAGRLGRSPNEILDRSPCRYPLGGARACSSGRNDGTQRPRTAMLADRGGNVPHAMRDLGRRVLGFTRQ